MLVIFNGHKDFYFKEASRLWGAEDCARLFFWWKFVSSSCCFLCLCSLLIVQYFLPSSVIVCNCSVTAKTFAIMQWTVFICTPCKFYIIYLFFCSAQLTVHVLRWMALSLVWFDPLQKYYDNYPLISTRFTTFRAITVYDYCCRIERISYLMLKSHFGTNLKQLKIFSYFDVANIELGAVHKNTSAQNRKKLITFNLSAKCPYWLNPLLSVRTHHNINFEKSEVFAPKSTSDSEDSPTLLSAKCPNWTNLPRLRTSFMDSPSWLTSPWYYGR